MSLAILTPFTGAPANKAGGRWRKKLLPVGEIAYKGKILKFTPDYLAGLVSAFNERAYDQVPFQLADAANTHTNDPERTAGQITSMQLADDGLYVELQPSARGAAVLDSNPGLGVSARIVESYDRADGKFFPRAIQHVLGTLDPRIPGMGGWSAVEAANDAEITFDLSGEHFTREEPGMPELTTEQTAKLAKLLNLDPGKLADALAGMEGQPGPAGDGEPAGDGDGSPLTPGEEADLDALAERIDGMSDEELAALEAEMEAEEAAGEGAEPEPAGLSSDTAMALELAQATGDENARQLRIITDELDHERWLGERAKLTTSGGIPPFIADLAAPLLEGSGHVVELSGGKTVDAGQVTRRILAETGKLLSQLGLQAGVELGTAMDEPESQGDAERDDVLKRARSQLFGMR